jgi:hypothetical protein
MPSSETPEEAAWNAAVALSPARPVSVERRLGGGNNRLYRVTTASDAVYALKWYPKRAGDSRDRLGTEYSALDFLGRCGVSEVPQAVAVDRVAGFALYEWIDGDNVALPEEADIDAALAFASRLHALRSDRNAMALPLASEACLSAADIIGQIDRRLTRLAQVAETETDLAQFLRDDFAMLYQSVLAWARTEYVSRGWDFETAIAPEDRSLSPSDFGFHNAVRRPDGRLVFVDFEYFGWDDPVKLAADFVQHPGMSLSLSLAGRFREGACRIYASDPNFAARLMLLQPLIGLRWCMILLNEFLPERWQSRTIAGAHHDRMTATRTQLEKARARATAIGRYAMAGRYQK